MNPPTDEELELWSNAVAESGPDAHWSVTAVKSLTQEVRRLREEREDSLSKWHQVAETLAERDRYRETLKLISMSDGRWAAEDALRALNQTEG